MHSSLLKIHHPHLQLYGWNISLRQWMATKRAVKISTRRQGFGVTLIERHLCNAPTHPSRLLCQILRHFKTQHLLELCPQNPLVTIIPKRAQDFPWLSSPQCNVNGLIQEEKYRKNIYNWRVLIDCKRLDLNQFSLPESFFFSQGNKNWNDFDKAKRWQSSIFLFVIIFVHTSLEKEPVSVASFSNRGILGWLNWS